MSDEKKHIIFDATILNNLQLCAMRYNLQHEMNLRTPEVPEPIEEGDMVHRMYETYYNEMISRGGTFQDNFDEVIDAAVNRGLEHSKGLQLAPAEIDETIYQFKEVTKHYRLDGITPLLVEHPFLLTLFEDDELGIHYAGMIDLVANTPEWGRCVIDHKTMRRKSTPLNLSNQFTGYAVAAQTNYAIVNKIGFQKSLDASDRFVRYPLFYTEEMKERWKTNTIWWGQQLAFYLENDTWPENRTSCDKYAGCIYIPICSAMNEEARQWAIKAKFVIGPEWDPTAVLKGVKV